MNIFSEVAELNTYYYITDKGTIGKAYWLNSYKDHFRKLHGNVYKDYKLIKSDLDNIKCYLKSE